MTRLRAPLSTRFVLLCTVKGVAVKKETGKIAYSVNKILMGYLCKGKGVFKEKNTTMYVLAIRTTRVVLKSLYLLFVHWGSEFP